MSKFVFRAGLFFAVAGALALALGLFILRDQLLFGREAIHTYGKVVGYVEREGDKGPVLTPQIAWKDANGVTHRFTAQIASRTPIYAVGQPVEIAYRTAEPGKARLTSFWPRWSGSFITMTLGLTFLATGCMLMWIYRSHRRRIAHFLQNGVPIEARFLYALTDRSIRSGGEHPWRIVCTAPDPATGGKRNFKSEPVWTHPSTLEQARFRVLLDPANSRLYQVDLSQLIPAEDCV
ncbi:DUF3592 domain-containing protein [Qipengyuania sp. 6B39]|uniref:DUF3592 domain-containing protein n=1 Tax=Qipengyuania proteolytica TaxID=2867239 RepID=UPI001C8ACC41|nr:DUF3592 domain-containing protein [Qipengyuania proteolytica]MBX7494406.1 DUF3592 domain-containing protein [Qipengyuania proteolytica]